MPSQEESLRVRTRAINEIKSIYEMVVSCELSHQVLTEKVLSVHNNTLKNARQWVREYVRGYTACLLDRIQREHVEFCYIVKGQRYSTRKESDIYFEKHHILPGELSGKPCGFYWKDSDRLFN